MDNYFTSNSAEGDIFLAGMHNTQIKWQNARKLFTQFILENGFIAWHIHDGWVQHNGRSGDVLHNNELELVWIDDHRGYSYGGLIPNVGDKIMILKDSPATRHPNELTPFDVYCYEVLSDKITFYHETKLKLIGVVQCIFNEEENKYQFHVPKIREKVSERIFNFLNNLFK